MMRPLGARRVEIHAGDPGLGEPPAHEVLELLGAQPPHPLGLLAAHSADRSNRLLVPAVVTPQCPRRLVHGEGDGAAPTPACSSPRALRPPRWRRAVAPGRTLPSAAPRPHAARRAAAPATRRRARRPRDPNAAPRPGRRTPPVPGPPSGE